MFDINSDSPIFADKIEQASKRRQCHAFYDRFKFA